MNKFCNDFFELLKIGLTPPPRPQILEAILQIFFEVFSTSQIFICPNTHIGLPSYAVNVTIFTKVNGATAKSVLCENLADTSWSRLVFFSRGGFP